MLVLFAPSVGFTQPPPGPGPGDPVTVLEPLVIIDAEPLFIDVNGNQLTYTVVGEIKVQKCPCHDLNVGVTTGETPFPDYIINALVRSSDLMWHSTTADGYSYYFFIASRTVTTTCACSATEWMNEGTTQVYAHIGVGTGCRAVAFANVWWQLLLEQ